MGNPGTGEEAPEDRREFSAVKKPGRMNEEVGNNGFRCEGIGAMIDWGMYSFGEGEESSGEESLLGVIEVGIGDWGGLNFLRSLEPLERERERERRLRVTVDGSGVPGISAGCTFDLGSTSETRSDGVSCDVSCTPSCKIPSPSLTTSLCICGRLPFFSRGRDAARLSFATAFARCSATDAGSLSMPERNAEPEH